MSASSSVEAVVLRVVPFGDADLVVHLLARGRGRMGVFARSARRSVRRFRGGLEPFSLLQADVTEKRSRDLGALSASSVVNPFLALRDDLDRLAHAGYATELVRELTREHEPNDPLLDLLLEFFDSLASVGARSLVLRAFELGALDLAGVAPVLGECSRCGRVLDEREPAGFDAAGGGAVCSRCASPYALAFDPATRRLLSALRDGGIAAAAAADDRQLPIEGARTVLRRFVDRHVQHSLRSIEFLREVGAPL